jgi:hypothetical protein
LLGSNLDIAVTSELTLAEVLPKANPIRRRNYLELILWSGLFNLYSVTRDVLMDTADYRKIAAVCGRMLSFDRALKLPDGICRLTREALPQLIEELS